MNIDQLNNARTNAIEASTNGAPMRTCNQFFGVGPITDMTADEYKARRRQNAFNAWLEATYPKLDDAGSVIGNFTLAEFNRGMHRGYPADSVLLDMMQAISRYFGFPDKNKIAVGLGGGHSGFSVAALHLMSAHTPEQKIFVDTPRPESDLAKKSGFFRQSWGAQLTEMMRYANHGDEQRLYFADNEGAIPTAQTLADIGVKLFFGVGHETTGATTYTTDEIKRLLAWIDLDPPNHHAVVDSTSMLGAMPWPKEVIAQVMDKCCLFTPFQKAIGGVSGYFIFSLTPSALKLIDQNLEKPSWAIPRQLKIAAPKDAKMPLSSPTVTQLGPLYCPATHTMLGGIINTFSTLAFAETTFAILQNEKNIGDIDALNQRSITNRQLVNDWIAAHSLFDLGVENPDSRGAAVTLIKVVDPDITDLKLHDQIIAMSKKLLGYDGLTHPNGEHEKGLDVARYVNAFPGTDGDYRAWIGGIRPTADITALLDNLEYCYQRAKIIVLEQRLQAQNITFDQAADETSSQRCDDPKRAYKILIVDLIGMRFDQTGNTDHSEVKGYIESNGGHFYVGLHTAKTELKPGMHFFYDPSLSTEVELLEHSTDGQYDALIAAATFIPPACEFPLGGVRIGAGTGNMAAASWGGGNGAGGAAPLMNTPSFNSRATAQMVFKALLKVLPDLPVDVLHTRVIEGDFDTGKNLVEYPTAKLEGKKMAVIGYGNIGREVARLARAFGMRVTIFARARHQKWIVSEGFEYADSISQAAKLADVISPHLGLGALNAKTGHFANEGVIDAEVFSAMHSGAVLINYDRGESINASDLDDALASGQISHAAIDADIFKDKDSGTSSGPMFPYLALSAKYPLKLALLPHAAADTEHTSRVEGAKQAVDQLYAVIQYRRVNNLVGDVPSDHSDANAVTVNGVGAVTTANLATLSDDDCHQLRDLSETLAAFWGAIDATKDANRRAELISRYASRATISANALQTLLADNGLTGPYYD